MELADDKKVLQHLLDLEADAADLVENAKAEADRQLSEAEKVCRANYDEAYSAEAVNLEAEYMKETAVINEEYKKQLEEYKENLRSRATDKAAFSTLVRQLLLREA
jgi:vacuolar-type H+-ATPase subunit H